MSEQLQEMAGDFLGVGDNLGERQNRLNAACAAWNIACGSPDVRRWQLEEYGASYRRYNPNTSRADLANILKDIQTLIDRKLDLFPEDKRQIVRAQVVLKEGGYRIEIVSATVG